jgi:L-amino acid N-acyltransferase YncA
MEKQFKLKDGTKVTIRPLTSDDVDKSLAFFQSLSDEERAYLRVDVTDRKIVAERVNNVGLRDYRRLAAVVDDKIVADGAIELNTHGWERHIGELRLMVADAFQRRGLGMLMAEELYLAAAQEKLEEIIVKLMAPQKNARRMFQRLGFKEDVVIKDYVKDVRGRKQDMVIMRCNLDALWRELEGYFQETDKLEMHG